MEPSVLVLSAVGVAVLHTVVGVDHSLPFVVLGRAQGWSLRRLWAVTALCGVGHVLSSVLLALAAIALGVAVDRVLEVEGTRGSVAAWLMIVFGTTYAVWAVWRTLRGHAVHSHAHAHDDGTVHVHGHDHQGRHLHMHPDARRRLVTTLALFLVFAFGPCEFLIAPLMAAQSLGWAFVALIAAVFGVTTIGTMLLLVTIGHYGLSLRRFAAIERHMHAVAGVTIALSGAAIELLGV